MTSALCLGGRTFFPFILSVFKLASFPKLISAFKYLLLRDRVEREVGGGIGMGNTCISMADSFQCMTKPTTIL